MARTYWKQNEPSKADEARIAWCAALYERITKSCVTQGFLINELRAQGMPTDRSEFSKVLHGKRRGPKIDVMLDMIDEILKELHQ